MKKLSIKYCLPLCMILIIILFWACDESPLPGEGNGNNTQSIDIVIDISYFNPDSIYLWSDLTGNWQQNKMLFETVNRLIFSFPFVTGDYTINFYYWMHHFPQCSEQWKEYGWISNDIAFRYATLKINNTTINNSFIKDNGLGGSNVKINIASNGNITPGSGTQLPINENIPPEVSHNKHTVENRTPPAGYSNVMGWMVALHDRRFDNELTKVEVKYLKLYAKVNGIDVLLRDDRYISGTSQDGGLYYRYPYFSGCDSHTGLPNYINSSDSTLVLEPSQSKDKVWHWWNSSNSTIPSNATSFRLEALVRLTGHVCVQGGIDFKQNAPQGVLSGASNWCFGYNNNGWQTVIYDSGN